jgi:hypothetical protein
MTEEQALPLERISAADVPRVGGRNASQGAEHRRLRQHVHTRDGDLR